VKPGPPGPADEGPLRLLPSRPHVRAPCPPAPRVGWAAWPRSRRP